MHRERARGPAPGTTTSVVIGVTNTSRVDVPANLGSADIDKACSLANQHAKLVEAKLS
jgi:hypothetical protein